MSKLEERVLVYTALVLLCSFTSAFLGLTAGIWTLIQMAAVIELMYLYGDPRRDRRAGS